MPRGKNITLSIVIPALNEQQHLPVCLEAITAQTEAPDEVIVVDNGSDDETAAVTKNYPFVTLLHEPRRGIVFARNRGFDAANSTLIGRIDADSILPPDWVARVRQFYSLDAHENTILSGPPLFYNTRLPRFLSWVHNVLVFRLNRLLLGHHNAWGSNMVIPQQTWRNVRPHACQRIDNHEDLDLTIHLSQLGAPIVYQKNLVVGAKLRRVASERHTLWQYLDWWPRTLRLHHLKNWPVAWLVAILLYLFSPVIVLTEHLAHLAGRAPKDL